MSVKDGLAAITNEVLDDVQKEANDIILNAENEAKENLKAAKAQADKNYQDIMDNAKETASAEKKKINSVTEVEIRNRLLQTKEELVTDVFERALIKLKDFAATEDYHNYLVNLILQVGESVSKKNLIVIVNAKDKAWLTQEGLYRISERKSFELKLSDQTEDYIGGCKIQTEDGKLTYDSTIDNRLRELKPNLRVEAARILFGEGV